MGANVVCYEGSSDGCVSEGAKCINGALLAEGHGPGFRIDERSQEMVNHKLIIAARDGDSEGVALALARGAWLGTRRPFVINQPGSSMQDEDKAPLETVGLTPLMHAANGGYAEVCELLLGGVRSDRWSAEVESEDEDGLRALHFAARSGSLQTCAVLLRYGADPGAQDADGRAPLDHVPAGEMSTSAERRTWHALLSEGAPAPTAAGSLRGRRLPPGQDNQTVRSEGEPERTPEAAAERPCAAPAGSPERRAPRQDERLGHGRPPGELCAAEGEPPRPPEPSLPAPVSLPGLAPH